LDPAFSRKVKIGKLTAAMPGSRLPSPVAVFFDLDDTLLRCASTAEQCWRELCERFTPQLEGVSATALAAAIEDSRSWFWRDAERHRRGRLDLPAARRGIVSAAFRRLGIDAPAVADALADAYTFEREERLELFPDALDVLQRLRDRHVRLALLTNGSRAFQRQKIERFSLAKLFDCIIIEGEFGVGKPDERVYRHALATLDVSPRNAWMIGDNLEWDVAAPQRLGMAGIWVDSAGSGLPAGSTVTPDRIVQRLSELV